MAQNSQLLKELKKEKSKRESNRYSSNSSSDNYTDTALDGIILLFDIFRIIEERSVYLQQKALQQCPDYREITSLEGSLNAGYYSKYNAVLSPNQSQLGNLHYRLPLSKNR